MIYDGLKAMILDVLKTPPEPSDPMGDVRSLKVFRASLSYYHYRLTFWLVKELGNAALMTFLCVWLVAVLRQGPLRHCGTTTAAAVTFLIVAATLFAIVAKALATYVVLRLDYEMRWYKVSDRSLRIREGVLKVREMTMTFANIQNISISQGPLQRLFNIADLKVESAGGVFMPQENTPGASFNLHVAFFRGVDNAGEIKTLMAERLKSYRDSGLGDQSPNEAGGAGPVEKTRLLEEIRDEAAAFKNSIKSLTAA